MPTGGAPATTDARDLELAVPGLFTASLAPLSNHWACCRASRAITDTLTFHDLSKPAYRACVSCHAAVHGSPRDPILLQENA